MAENLKKNMHELIVSTVNGHKDEMAFKWFQESGDLAGVTCLPQDCLRERISHSPSEILGVEPGRMSIDKVTKESGRG